MCPFELLSVAAHCVPFGAPLHWASAASSRSDLPPYRRTLCMRRACQASILSSVADSASSSTLACCKSPGSWPCSSAALPASPPWPPLGTWPTRSRARFDAPRIAALTCTRYPWHASDRVRRRRPWRQRGSTKRQRQQPRQRYGVQFARSRHPTPCSLWVARGYPVSGRWVARGWPAGRLHTPRDRRASLLPALVLPA